MRFPQFPQLRCSLCILLSEKHSIIRIGVFGWYTLTTKNVSKWNIYNRQSNKFMLEEKQATHRALSENIRSLSLEYNYQSNWFNERKVAVELSWSGKTHISHTVVKQGAKHYVATFRLAMSCQTGSSLRASKTWVLNLFPVKYTWVVKQSTRTPRSAGKTVDFTLLHHNNARSGKIYSKFSTGSHFPLV